MVSNEISKHEIRKASEVDIDALNTYLSQPGIVTGEDRYDISCLFTFYLTFFFNFFFFSRFLVICLETQFWQLPLFVALHAHVK